MLADGLPNIYSNPAAALGPCFAIVVAGVAFVLAGELLTQLIAGQETAARARKAPIADAPLPAPSDAIGPTTRDDVLRVQGLKVSFPRGDARIEPVAGVSFAVGAGEIVGVVGESGSGKSLTALAVSSLIASPGAMHAEVHQLRGADIGTMRSGARDRLLGTSVAMMFQDPMSALNPVIRVGRQLAEVSEVHQGLRRSEALDRAVDRLSAVQIPDAQRRAGQYPFEFSGGMRQRAMIGMGLMGEPVLIVADEPTTALDVVVQQEILALLRRVRDEHGAGVLFISHDIGVIAEIATRVLVMYSGRIVEDLPVSALHDAAHPYTRGLVASVPDLTTDREQPLATIPGRPPDPAARPAGCAFAPRCPFADAKCHVELPPLEPFDDGRRVACWHPRTGAVRDVPVIATRDRGNQP
jgi:oligopeptide/dipeptide ABC transporter ATP-binding protein